MGGPAWSEARKRTDLARRTFRALPKDLKNTIRKAQRAELNPIWRAAMSESVSRAPYAVQRTVFKAGTRAEVGVPLYLIAGASSKRMRGGGTPMGLDTVVEFGSTRAGKVTRYTRRGRHGTHTVTRRVATGLPARKPNGYVVFPAVANALPKVVGSMAAAITKRIYDAADGVS